MRQAQVDWQRLNKALFKVPKKNSKNSLCAVSLVIASLLMACSPIAKKDGDDYEKNSGKHSENYEDKVAKNESAGVQKW